jgi:hypothetical protein
MFFNPPAKNAARLLAPVLIAFLGVLFLLASAHNAAGQEEEEAWTAPINLSKSGSAADPQIIGDSLNTVHVIWQDTVDESYVHVRSVEAGWSEPIVVELPFGTRRFFELDEDDPTPLFKPILAATPDGALHAIWIDSELDLYHSSVAADGFDEFSNWSGRVKIASAVLVATFKASAEGRLHVAYIQSADLTDLPAGLYYRYSDNGGESWSDPVALQTSSYFRLQTIETANIQLDADNGFVYIAWDDDQNGRVYLTRSLDNGQTWEAINAIDKREEADAVDAVSPKDIRVAAKDGQVHATWQAGHDGLICVQYSAWSRDGGQTWQPRERILDRLLNCPVDVRLLDTSTTQFMMGTVSDRFLAPWYGSRWGRPEDQPSLSSFIDPETLRQVTFSCGQDAITRGDDLLVVSCGVDISQDIWIQQRSLTKLAQPTVELAWDLPFGVAEGVLPIVDTVFVTDEENRAHAFWVQPANEADVPFGPRSTEIHYAQWAEGRWSRPVSILTSPEGKAEEPSVTVDGKGRILAVWSGGNHGEIYFSSTSTASASLPSEWSSPIQITEAEQSAASPVIVVDPAGTIFIAYAIPLGDRRGIYIVSSTDEGLTWSDPVAVFNGAAAGWEGVAEPRLEVTSAGNIHALWLHRPLPTSLGGDELYYAQSTDGGANWTPAESVKSSDQDGGPVLWHAIASSGANTVVRVWQEWIFNRLNFWYQHSVDNGQTWSEPAQIVVLEGLNVPSSLTVDAAGQFHLLFSRRAGEEDAVLGYIVDHWILAGDEWLDAEDLVPNRSIVASIRGLQAVVMDNVLSVLVSSEVKDDPIDEVIVTERLYASQRAIELPDVTPMPPPVASATPTLIPSPEPTATPEPTPTLSFPVDAGPRNTGVLPGQLNSMAGIIFGTGAVALLIIGLFIAIGVNRFRANRLRR